MFRWAKLKLSIARPGDMPVISYDRLMNMGPVDYHDDSDVLLNALRLVMVERSCLTSGDYHDDSDVLFNALRLVMVGRSCLNFL